MSWAEWGTKVFRNGERRRDREADLEHVQYHGLLGDGVIRIRFARDLPKFEVGEVDVSMVNLFDELDDWTQHHNRTDRPDQLSVSFGGTELTVRKRSDRSTAYDFEFVEADGTKWTGSAGYVGEYWIVGPGGELFHSLDVCWPTPDDPHCLKEAAALGVKAVPDPMGWRMEPIA